MKSQIQQLIERMDALDAQMAAIRRQQDQLTKRRKQIQLQRAQQAVQAGNKPKGS
jgi:prefoldin subunit 5